MASRFEELVAWQRARSLTKAIYLVSSEGRLARDFGLASQLQRASVSIMANIAEGFERNRLAEFARFIDIARGSAAEVLSHLYVARDVGHLSEEQFHQLERDVREVSRLLNGLGQSVRRKLEHGGRLAEEASTYDPGNATGSMDWALGTEHWALEKA